MVDFRLDEEQEALRATVRDFAREQVAPVIAEQRAEYERDIDIVRLASELVVDSVVEPSALRAELIVRYAAAAGKDRHFSRRRHGVTPV